LRTIAVKGHPSDLVLKEEISWATGTPVVNIRFVYKAHRKKCQKGSIHFWEKIILLVRNPYHAIFAEFQRSVSGSHAGVANLTYFNTSTNHHNIWIENAMKSAEDYDVGMEHLVHPIVYGSHLASSLVKTHNGKVASRLIPRPQTFSANFTSVRLPMPAVVVARFENLLDKATRFEELQRILTFMNVSVPKERIECAFLLADLPLVHRPKKLNITWAYKDVKPSLTLEMWRFLSTFSNAFDYPPWGTA